jgi:hypothetical protein
MLLISDVYNLLLDELRADKRGQSLEISEYNRICRLVNYELYADFCKKFETDTENIDTLGWYKVNDYGIDLTSGVGTIPSNYYRIIGKPRTLDGTTTRYVDLVTEFEHACREEDYLTKATVVHPTCRISGVNATEQLQIRIAPTTTIKVWLDYLRMLVTPYLDWFINDTTLNYTFFAETTTPQSVAPGCIAPAVVINGITYRNVTTGGAGVTVTSFTKNFRWDESDLSLLITKLVNRVAKQLPDELLLQTSMAEQTKADIG